MSVRRFRRASLLLGASLLGAASLAGAQNAAPACAGQLVRDVTGQVCIPKLPKRIDGLPDFLLEYEIRDLTQGQPYSLWYAHFHYQSQTPGFERFTKAHLKTAEQRRLGLQWQLAQGEGAERIWRGDIGRPMAKKHFAELFRQPASQ